MHRSSVVFLFVILAAFFSSGIASAQNMLTNPDFDTDLAGWGGNGWWDQEDAFGSPTSGSATWINDWSSAGSIYEDQCVPVPSDFKAYDLAGYVYIPTGQPVNGGRTYVYLAFYSEADCDQPMEILRTEIFTDLGTWELLTMTDWVPVGAVSARVGLANYKDSPGDFQVHHDSIFFGRSAEWVFADGFESGDLAAWNAVPVAVK